MKTYIFNFLLLPYILSIFKKPEPKVIKLIKIETIIF